ncbi:MAG: 4Fe-4S binding protein [Candidatus Bathyarchaeia archaeon]
MNIDNCVDCYRCILYCPVGAIKRDEGFASIDQDECVECAACLKAGVCEPGALYQPELNWPRVLRSQFSDPLAPHPVTGITGRGTEEMKTNDVTGRFREGEVGFAVEMGRPGVATTFREVERVAEAVASLGVEFESHNPVTALLDLKTGRLRDPVVGGERVLSAIVEFKTGRGRLVEVLKELERVAGGIDTVFSLCVISRCEDGGIPILRTLEEAGFAPRINGKTNVGLGRPLKP